MIDNDIKDGMKVVGIVGTSVIAALATISFIVSFATSTIKKYNCEAYGKAAGLATVSTYSECYVKTDIGLTQLDRYQLELIYNRKNK